MSWGERTSALCRTELPRIVVSLAWRTGHIKQRPTVVNGVVHKILFVKLQHRAYQIRARPVGRAVLLTPVVTRIHLTRAITRPLVSSMTQKTVWTRNGEKTLNRKSSVVQWRESYDDGSRGFVESSKQITNNLTQRNMNPRL